NLPEIEKTLRAAGNKDVTAMKLPGLNHLFQEATTGHPAEYATIRQTVSPLALNAMTQWLRKQAGHGEQPQARALAPKSRDRTEFERQGIGDSRPCPYNPIASGGNPDRSGPARSRWRPPSNQLRLPANSSATRPLRRAQPARSRPTPATNLDEAG